MNRDERVAFINSQVACALIEMQAMVAANYTHALAGAQAAYKEGDFLGVITKYKLSEKEVVAVLEGKEKAGG